MADNRRGPRGFVLPTTLMVMTLLTVMLTAAFTLISAEYRTTDNSFGRSRAHALAEAGLHSYFAATQNLGGSQDSVRYTMTNGYVDVVARRLRDSTTTHQLVWLVRATGYSTDGYQSGQVQGKRTVARLAVFNPASFPAEGALFALNGLHVDGPSSYSNPVSGNDSPCNTPNPEGGLTTPSGTYTESGGGTSDPVGAPPIDYRASPAQVLSQTRVNWASLMAGNFTADYTLPAGPVVWTGTPVVLIQGDYTLSGSTSGMPTNPNGVLVVTGDLRVEANFHWSGILLVGGRLTSYADGVRLHGVVITGLNIALGASVPADTIRRGANTQLYWASCYIDNAVTALSGLIPVGNAWVDTWSAY